MSGTYYKSGYKLKEFNFGLRVEDGSAIFFFKDALVNEVLKFAGIPSKAVFKSIKDNLLDDLIFVLVF